MSKFSVVCHMFRSHGVCRETVSCYHHERPLSKPLLRIPQTPLRIGFCLPIVQPRMKPSCGASQHHCFRKSIFDGGARQTGRNSLASNCANMSTPLRAATEKHSTQERGPAESSSIVGATEGAVTKDISSLNRVGDAEVGESRGEIIEGLPEWAKPERRQHLPRKLLTLVLIQKDDKVLLGMKKRGFGKGYYNGFGGKVEKGETIDSAAARELQEESGVEPVDMTKRGILTFHFDNDPVPWEVHVYHVSEIVGEPQETDEMKPKWFGISEIPYESMWSDDPIWYPEFLNGRQFQGDFYFENTTTLVAHSLRLTSLP